MPSVQERYLAMGRKELRNRVHLRSDDSTRYITYYQQEYWLDQQDDGLSLAANPTGVIPFNTTMDAHLLFIMQGRTLYFLESLSLSEKYNVRFPLRQLFSE